jgi:hypothetical protein
MDAVVKLFTLHKELRCLPGVFLLLVIYRCLRYSLKAHLGHENLNKIKIL